MHINSFIKAALAMLAACAMYSMAAALPINGVINFKGGALLNTSTVNTATQVIANGWSGVTVDSASGDYASLAGDAVAMSSLPWNFNSGPIPGFWSIGGVGGFSFDLTSSSIVSQGGGFLNVVGSGYANGPGFDSTLGSWRFSTQDSGTGSPAQFSFSSSTTVPDGGTTALLLGLGLLGVGLGSRRFKLRKA